jgi:ABC-type transport system involved in cytochrome c biogenesis ATPase subunit
MTVKLSYEYKDPSYHVNPDDPPFKFPPENEIMTIDGNLLEILGRNGTGKSTLLNIIALSMGFLRNDQELGTKPALKEKLQSLESNSQLKYHLDIQTQGPDKYSINIDKQPGKNQIVSINNSNLGSSVLENIDIIFLTEDDPKKVVTLSIGKILSHIAHIEKKLLDFNSFVSKTQREILAHAGKEEQITKLNDQIKKANQNITEHKKNVRTLESELVRLNEKNTCEVNYNTLINETEIRAEYKKWKSRQDKIIGVNYADLKTKYDKIGRKIVIERNKLYNVIELEIRDICDKLRSYNISLDHRKIVNSDFSELEVLEKKLRDAKISTRGKNEGKMVTDMIKLFQRYSPNDVIPVFDVPISGVLEKLYYLNDTLYIDNIEPILKKLDREIKKHDKQRLVLDDLKSQLNVIEEEMNNLGNVKTINDNFHKAQTKYVELQRVLKLGKTNILEKWDSLKALTGNAEHVTNDIYDLNGKIKYNQQQIKTAESRLSRYEQEDDSSPKYLSKKNQIEQLFKKIVDMRQKSSHWIRILTNPRRVKEELEVTNKYTDFTIADYTKFVNSVGTYLGKQFEPVFFADKRHDITFLDMEANSFKTTDGRIIYISDLSQGQSKITSLSSSIKKLDTNKKTIVLIDEIADLDPSNMKLVKSMLSEYYKKGLIIMAVLVRPMTDETTEKVSISAWD